MWHEDGSKASTQRSCCGQSKIQRGQVRTMKLTTDICYVMPVMKWCDPWNYGFDDFGRLKTSFDGCLNDMLLCVFTAMRRT